MVKQLADGDWDDATRARIAAAVARVTGSPVFAVSERQQRLFAYLVDELVNGRADRINQASIAIDVLGRDERFDPAVDSIVRVEAARLRSKLREYYDTDGRDEATRITLPKGKYVPRVQFIDEQPENLDQTRDLPAPGFDIRVDQPVPGFRMRPGIAVLPFEGGGEEGDGYFADGLTEDIITGLSLFKWFPVISRNSSFAYQGRKVDARTVAAELGVRYVLEGSVRKSGDRVRVSAQLIDTVSQVSIWAKRFDRTMADIFAVQDELAEAIVTSIAPEFQRVEIQAVQGRRPEDFEAWELMARGLSHYYQRTASHNREARECFEEARRLDPAYGRPLAWISFSHIIDVVSGWSDGPGQSFALALLSAREAVALDPQSSDAFAALALAQVYNGMHEEALDQAETAVELNPSNANSYLALGVALCWAGEFGEAVEALHRALRLNPLEPNMGLYLNVLSMAYLMLDQNEEAARAMRRSIQSDPTGYRLYARLAIALQRLGDGTGAAEAVERADQLGQPTLEYMEATHPFRQPARLAGMLDEMRAIGLAL